MRQRAGGFTAIDGLRAERVCADNVKDDIVRRQRSGNAQTTCNGTEVSAKSKSAVSVRCVSVVTTAETLRRERMCANGGRIYGDNVQIKECVGMHRQRQRRRQ